MIWNMLGFVARDASRLRGVVVAAAVVAVGVLCALPVSAQYRLFRQNTEEAEAPRATPRPAGAAAPASGSGRSAASRATTRSGRSAATAAAAPRPVVRPRVQISGASTVADVQVAVVGAAPGDEPLLRQVREGADFRYVVTGLSDSVPAQIDMLLLEPRAKAAGERLMRVTINERVALDNFDIVTEAGGAGKPVQKKFSITPRRGFVELRFEGVRGDAVVSFVRVVSGTTEINLGADVSPDALNPRATYNANVDAILQTQDLDTWSAGVPLGGLGTGKFEILPNGTFGNFTTNKNFEHPITRPRGTFLAVATKYQSGGGTARLLHVGTPDDYRASFPGVPTMTAVGYRGQWPFATLSYREPDLPVSLTVRGFSPMVPGNAADSSIPAAVIYVDVENTRNGPVSVALALSWEDIAGRTGSVETDRPEAPATAVHRDETTTRVAGLTIENDLGSEAGLAGGVGATFLGVETRGVSYSRWLNWNPSEARIPWWQAFSRKLRLTRRQATEETWRAPVRGAGIGAPGAAVVCATLNLFPKEKRTVPFVVAWHTPNIRANADGTQVRIASHATRFASPAQIAGYVAENRARLESETAAMSEIIEASSLPQWMKTHVVNSLATISANSVMLADGRWGLLECPSLNSLVGATALRPAVSEFMATMFPALERDDLLALAARTDAESGTPTNSFALRDDEATTSSEGNVEATAALLVDALRYVRATDDRDFLTSAAPGLRAASAFLAADHSDAKSAAQRQAGQAPEGATLLIERAGLFAARELAKLSSASADGAAVESALARTQALLARDFVTTSTPAIVSPLSLSRASEPPTYALLLAGEAMARRAALPPVAPMALLSATAERIRNAHMDRFAPAVPLTVSAAGDALTSSTPMPLVEAFFGFSALGVGNLSAGYDIMMRGYNMTWQLNRDAWSRGFLQDVRTGRNTGLRGHVANLASWGALQAMSGIVVDAPDKTLYLDARIPTNAGAENTIPVFTARFWGLLHVASDPSSATLVVLRVPEDRAPLVIRRVAQHPGTGVGQLIMDSDSDLDFMSASQILMPEPIPLVAGARLELQWSDQTATVSVPRAAFDARDGAAETTETATTPADASTTEAVGGTMTMTTAPAGVAKDAATTTASAGSAGAKETTATVATSLQTTTSVATTSVITTNTVSMSSLGLSVPSTTATVTTPTAEITTRTAP